MGIALLWGFGLQITMLLGMINLMSLRMETIRRTHELTDLNYFGGGLS